MFGNSPAPPVAISANPSGRPATSEIRPEAAVMMIVSAVDRAKVQASAATSSRAPPFERRAFAKQCLACAG